mmetsp:Transcript_12737/g.25319  ORF Transcript_12737/g.25319 Transcript_12737/m.25319 type:complete len:331 (-) Transcript_12737:351-1343(-)
MRAHGTYNALNAPFVCNHPPICVIQCQVEKGAAALNLYVWLRWVLVHGVEDSPLPSLIDDCYLVLRGDSKILEPPASPILDVLPLRVAVHCSEDGIDGALLCHRLSRRVLAPTQILQRPAPVELDGLVGAVGCHGLHHHLRPPLRGDGSLVFLVGGSQVLEGPARLDLKFSFSRMILRPRDHHIDDARLSSLGLDGGLGGDVAERTARVRHHVYALRVLPHCSDDRGKPIAFGDGVLSGGALGGELIERLACAALHVCASRLPVHRHDDRLDAARRNHIHAVGVDAAHDVRKRPARILLQLVARRVRLHRPDNHIGALLLGDARADSIVA